jgi:hypothetical protein
MLYSIKYTYIFYQLCGVCFISRILFSENELPALNVAVHIELLAKFSEIRNCGKLVRYWISSVRNGNTTSYVL